MPGRTRVITAAMLKGPEFPVTVTTGKLVYQHKGKTGWVDGPTMSREAVTRHISVSALKLGRDYRFIVKK